MSNLELFIEAYIAAALWSSTGDDEEPLDLNYSKDDLSIEAALKIGVDCALFFETIKGLTPVFDELPEEWIRHAGHDFWLTRCGHGCGFWDGDWDDFPFKDDLDRVSKEFGKIDLYVGDDGKLYF